MNGDLKREILRAVTALGKERERRGKAPRKVLGGRNWISWRRVKPQVDRGGRRVKGAKSW
jgi:hypothetical protein